MSKLPTIKIAAQEIAERQLFIAAFALTDETHWPMSPGVQAHFTVPSHTGGSGRIHGTGTTKSNQRLYHFLDLVLPFIRCKWCKSKLLLDLATNLFRCH